MLKKIFPTAWAITAGMSVAKVFFTGSHLIPIAGDHYLSS